MKNAVRLVSIVAMLLVAPASFADSSSQSFIKEAMAGNLWEVQAGQLAREKASRPEVREFGAMLNNDHGEATRRAAEAAQALGVTPPTSLTARQRTLYERLSAAGNRFDDQFIRAMIEDHRQDIAKYEKQSQRPADAAVAYAKETLPRLREHLRIAEGLKAPSAGSK